MPYRENAKIEEPLEPSPSALKKWLAGFIHVVIAVGVLYLIGMLPIWIGSAVLTHVFNWDYVTYYKDRSDAVVAVLWSTGIATIAAFPALYYIPKALGESYYKEKNR